MNRCKLLGLLLAATLLAGCERRGEATVRGTVTLDGKPLPSGIVAFHANTGGTGVAPSGDISSYGHYEVFTGKVRGLAAGDYAVTVVAYEPMTPELANAMGMPKRLTPQRYGQPGTSRLRAMVKPGGNQIDLALTH